jgi:L-ascorbate metabolism protein UlaG (beta-lactamase superfamily)
MATRASDAGFTDVQEVSPGDTKTIDGVQITALSGAHVVHEITYLLTDGSTTVYFGGDTLLTPEVREIAEHGPFDIALLPVNGLRVGGAPAVSSLRSPRSSQACCEPRSQFHPLYLPRRPGDR